MQDNRTPWDDIRMADEDGAADSSVDSAGMKSVDQAAAKPETGTDAASEKPAPTDGKKPGARSKAKAKKPAKKDDALGKGMTLDEMEAKREALRAEAKSWTDAIDKRKREERAREEKAKRLQEQRDALEFYRKYREYIEVSRSMTLQSGKTFFERIEQEVMRGRTGSEG